MSTSSGEMMTPCYYFLDKKLEKGRMKIARYIWRKERGRIPKGLSVCHRCDNPPCINIDHLFLGTPKENTQDMMRKGRNARGDGNAKLTVEQVKYIRESSATAGDLTKQFGVSQGTIYNIRRRKTWKSV